MSSPAVRESLQLFARRTLLARERSLSARFELQESDAQELFAKRETDWEDRAANIATAAGLESLGDKERAEFGRVAAGLERLEGGTWGSCVSCGKPIAEARLRIVPEATRCASCTDHQ